jgi:hypothetical protein
MQSNLPKPLDSLASGNSAKMVDVNDGYAVLDFMYAYLRKQKRAPSDPEIRTVSAALARYRGPPLVMGSALEAFLARTD